MNKEITNRNGIIKIGDKVRFKVENQDMWSGDLVGTLDWQNGEFVIKTENSGIITIDKGYDAYFHTLEKINPLIK